MRTYTAGEVRAAAGDRPVRPIDASANEDDVLLIVDADTARDLAAAWSAWHMLNEPHAIHRPGWEADVTALVTAAAHADLATDGRTVTVDGVPHRVQIIGGAS